MAKSNSTTKARKINTDFSKLRNLAYAPENPAGYFYFSTLKDTWENAPNAEYTAKSREVAEQGEAYLSNRPTGLNENDAQSKATLEQIQKILIKAIEVYKKNEISYFNRKINEMTESKLFTKEEIADFSKRLQNLENKQNYNAEDIIILYNEILQGKINTKAIIDFEQQHLQELEKRLETAKQVFENDLEKGTFDFAHNKRDKNGNLESQEAFEARMRKKFERARQNMYLSSHSLKNKTTKSSNSLLSQFEDIFVEQFSSDELDTADMKIARVITTTLQDVIRRPDIFKQIRDNIQLDIDNHIGNFSESEKNIQHLLIQEITKTCVEEISTILSGSINTQIIVDKFLERFKDNNFPALNADLVVPIENYAQKGNYLNIFTTNANSAEGLSAALAKLVRTVENPSFNKDKHPEWQEAYDFLMQENGQPTTVQHFLYFTKKIVRNLKRDQKEIQKNNKSKTKSEHKHNFTFIAKNGQKIILPIYVRFNGTDVVIYESKTQEAFKRQKNAIEQFDPGLAQMLDNFINKTLKNSKTEQTYSNVSNTLNRQLGQKLKNIIIQKKEQNNRIYHALENGLQKLQISVSGPGISEVKAAFQSTPSDQIFHSGPINVKDDIVITATVNINNVTQSIKTSMTSLLKTAMPELNTILSQAESDLMDTADKFIQQIESMLTQNAHKENYDYNKYKDNFNEQRNATLKTMHEIVNNLEKQIREQNISLKERQKIEKRLFQLREKWIENFNSTIYRSDTMKTFTNYQNDIGFVGGSLGATVSDQVSRINDFFTAAGVPLNTEQQQWLISAVINCSPQSIVGESQKDFIENFLGTLAVFGLFNEATIELEQLSNQLQEKTQNNNDAKFLHLYGVNSLYYPGSYVLTIVKQNLDPIFKDLANLEKTQKNQNIKISNPMGRYMLPNKNGNLTDTHPWETVRDIAEKKVTLNVVFLAGLLDVLTRLQEKVSNPLNT